MEKYFKRLKPGKESSSSSVNQHDKCKSLDIQDEVIVEEHELDIDNLPSDPGMRPCIMSYPVEKRDQVRRAYLLKGPCQPRNHNFPKHVEGNRKRNFVVTWFDEFKDWLEYSIEKDVVFCLYCYLFSSGYHERGQPAFVSEGFNNWRKKRRLVVHVGEHDSDHNRCRLSCQDLMNQSQSIELSFAKQSEKSKIEYRCRLYSTLQCIRYLLEQGLPFRGNDESEKSLNRGNFLCLLKMYAKDNEKIRNVVLNNAPENLKLTSPDIQHDIIKECADETTKAIISDLDGDLFSILVDECRDVSVKEQMGLVIRYVNKLGCVVERFLGIVHVRDTTATSLHTAIKSLLSTHDLSISGLRGQGYDGASNMGGEFNGLKSLILKENPNAYYIHCFAHQLQLTLVAIARDHSKVCSFFNVVTRLCNVVGGSCKRRDILREKQKQKIADGISQGVLATGQGLNQEMALKRPGDTRWGSHYGTLINLVHLFDSITDVLEYVEENGFDRIQRAEASDLIILVNQFEFIFMLQLMIKILGVTNELSQVLQKRDQDIVNAVSLVKVSKNRLQTMRNDGWESLLKQVLAFCNEHNVDVVDMNDVYINYTAIKSSRRRSEELTNLHHYRVELFYTVIDMQLQELNRRFDETNTNLLLCMACLDPRDSFSAFDTDKLITLARFYPYDFSPIDLITLESQLENFIVEMRMDENFHELNGIGDLAKKMVSSRKHDVFPLVFNLIKLLLLLPVATATVKRVFSAMKIVKTPLRNKMGDQLLNDCLICYIERDVFESISDEVIMHRFQSMKSRRGSL